jgi:hypothetical protein
MSSIMRRILDCVGNTVYAYIAFKNPTTGEISISSYAGTVNVLL